MTPRQWRESKKQKFCVHEVKKSDRFPIENVSRIMEAALPKDARIDEEAKKCMQECVAEFVSFITSEAAASCTRERRKTLDGEDIITAMTSLGFDDYAEAMAIYLRRYREHQTSTVAVDQHSSRSHDATRDENRRALSCSPGDPNLNDLYSGEDVHQESDSGSSSICASEDVPGLSWTTTSTLQTDTTISDEVRDVGDIADPSGQKLSRMTYTSAEIRYAMIGYEESADNRCDMRFNVNWELPYCLSAFYPPGVRLGDVMTITGNSIEAYATSCRKYVAEFLPGISQHIFSALEEFLEVVLLDMSRSRVGEYFDPMTDMRIFIKHIHKPRLHQKSKISPHVSIMKFHVQGSSKLRIQISRLLRWLYAAIRNSQQERLCLLETAWKVEDRSIMIELGPLMAVQRIVCWHHLFSNTVVAGQFSIPKRSQGKGLEISLSDMISLSRSLRMRELSQCFIAEGPQNLFILMENLLLDGGFQWHLEEKRSPNPIYGEIRKATATEILSGSKLRACFKEVDFDILNRGRNFLGWTPSAEVNLGTSIDASWKFS